MMPAEIEVERLLYTTPEYIVYTFHTYGVCIIESVDSISRDERDVPLTQYITNA